ncbi:hypothetical protein FMM05_14335 [Flavobacterium zepuense]|uniref:Uncharacterized protein n=1 Tax=Flavobacterium zepuense TaxID=2593302 RepID=A0A552UYT5_9FLAO|nr:hypothetical protein [Flavobacterium zepuense]TRW23368.1 hypothetical protein FMM05_14335 [Flavobacterium zepuense]
METKSTDWLKLACIIILAIIFFASAAQAASLLFMFGLLPQDDGFLGTVRSICSGILGLMIALALTSLIAIFLHSTRYFYYVFALAVLFGLGIALY